MHKIIHCLFMCLLLAFTTFSMAANTKPTPMGDWLLSTQTYVTVSIRNSNIAPITSDVIKGYEYASFKDKSIYLSSDWIDRLSLYVKGDLVSIALTVGGQWVLNKNSYTITYDPFLLSFKNNNGLAINEPFFKRSDYFDTLVTMLDTPPSNINATITSYFDNGKLLSKGTALKGSKKTVILANWTSTNNQDMEAEIDVTVKYTGKRVTVVSTCCAQGSNVTQNGIESAQFLADNEKFLQSNVSQSPIKTSSGLQYLMLQQGRGTTKPLSSDNVIVNYRGYLPSGTIFDRGSLVSFEVNQVIPGFSEGLQMMTPGSKYRFFIPPSLAYGETGTSNGNIPGNAALVFDVELVQITPP